jgi:hypothetical protein
MRRGDKIVLWMGHGELEQWGILGFAYISDIQNIEGKMKYLIKQLYVPENPLTPYPKNHPDETKNTIFLRDTFSLDFSALKDVFSQVQYVNKRTFPVTVDKITACQYSALWERLGGKSDILSEEIVTNDAQGSISHPGFIFQPGFRPKISSTTSVQDEKQVDISLRHNKLQEMLYQELSKMYGEQNIGTENNTGMETKIDLVVRHGEEYWFYEIKTEKSSRLCIRQALGQLLEYSLWPRPGSQEASKLIVAGEVKLDTEGEEYLSILRKKYALPLEYHQIMKGL